jgi:lysylphosphatidylglycerol synthetase-like protein (DUF2156 family)
MREAPKEYSPFDDDAEQQEDGPSRGFGSTASPWFRRLLMSAAVSLAIAIVSSIVLNNSAGNRDVEDVAYYLNRIFMTLMLLSCAGMLVAIRGPQIATAVQKFSQRRESVGKQRWPVWLSLFLSSLVAFFILAILFILLAFAMPFARLTIVLWLAPTLLALLITIAVNTRREVQAYAIGAAVTLAIGSFIATYFAVTLIPFSSSPYYYNRGGNSYALLWCAATIGTISWSMFNGLVCAGYVSLFQPMKSLPTEVTSPTTHVPSVPPAPIQ